MAQDTSAGQKCGDHGSENARGHHGLTDEVKPFDPGYRRRIVLTQPVFGAIQASCRIVGKIPQGQGSRPVDDLYIVHQFRAAFLDSTPHDFQDAGFKILVFRGSVP